MAFYGLWERERPAPVRSSLSSHGFPSLAGVVALSVSPVDGTAPTSKFLEKSELAELLGQLAQATPSYFGDPEPLGRLYEVRMTDEEGEVRMFELNDLRGTGSRIAGKMYPVHPGRDEVWALPPALIGRLVDSAQPS